MITISKPLSSGQARAYHREEFGNARLRRRATTLALANVELRSCRRQNPELDSSHLKMA